MRLVLRWLLVSFSVAEAENPPNWSADYPPCDRHSELLKHGHMDLGVRLATANRVLAEQFRRAMESWARILDLDWHEDDTQNCSIQLVDGDRELFRPAEIVARSQLPDRLNFQGWVAFNTAQTLGKMDFYRSHMLGLNHSSSAKSVMYFFNLEGPELLDPADLAALAERHKLRIATLDKAVSIGASPRPEVPR